MSYMPLENISILGAIHPASGAGGNSGWISVADHAKMLAVGLIGATDHDINAKLEGASDGTGTGAADLTGYAITEIGNASADNKQFAIEIKSAVLSKLGFTHIRFSVAGAGGTAALAAGLVFGVEPYAAVPGVTRDAASVVQKISVRP